MLARVVWATVAIAALAIVLFSVPSSFEHYRTVCTAASETCSERAVGQPTFEGVRSLREVALYLLAGHFFLLRGIFKLQPQRDVGRLHRLSYHPY